MWIENNICQKYDNPEFLLCKNKFKENTVHKTRTNLFKIISSNENKYFCKNNKDTLCNFLAWLKDKVPWPTFRYFNYSNLKKAKWFKIKWENLVNYKAFFNTERILDWFLYLTFFPSSIFPNLSSARNVSFFIFFMFLFPLDFTVFPLFFLLLEQEMNNRKNVISNKIFCFIELLFLVYCLRYFFICYTTVSIWGVGRFEAPNFQFTIPFVYIHNLSFNHLLPNALYTLLCAGSFLVSINYCNKLFFFFVICQLNIRINFQSSWDSCSDTYKWHNIACIGK